MLLFPPVSDLLKEKKKKLYKLKTLVEVTETLPHESQ